MCAKRSCSWPRSEAILINGEASPTCIREIGQLISLVSYLKHSNSIVCGFAA